MLQQKEKVEHSKGIENVWKGGARPQHDTLKEFLMKMLLNIAFAS